MVSTPIYSLEPAELIRRLADSDILGSQGTVIGTSLGFFEGGKIVDSLCEDYSFLRSTHYFGLKTICYLLTTNQQV